MFLLDWFYSMCAWLGFFKKTAKVVILGLGNAGKTTLLYVLSHDIVKVHVPTNRPNNDTFTCGGVNFNAYDLGGQQNIRTLWKQYLLDKTIVIFMVDSTDYDAILESKIEIHKLLQDENVNNSAILILGSKIDCPKHYNKEQLLDLLDLRRFNLGLNKSSGNRPLDLLMISSARRIGFKDLSDWLCQCADIVNQD